MSERLSYKCRDRLGAFELDAAFELQPAGTTALFGPSGAGKTTILRHIAGLATPAEGTISLGDETWVDTRAGVNTKPHKRPVGLVFQDARLFPHLTVAGNLGFAKNRSKAKNVDEIIQTLDLAPLLDQRPSELSGGEAKRVALGRTLLAAPRLLLLDEPMSGLDARRKSEIMPYLARLSQGFNIPTLLVSHSIDEVAQLAAQVILVDNGKTVADGPAEDILAAPAFQSLTGRFEAGTRLSVQVTGHDPALHLTTLSLGPQTITMPMIQRLDLGDEIHLRVRARDVALATERPKNISIRNVLKAIVTGVEAEKDTAFAEISLDASGQPLRARITRASVADLRLVPGQEVYALVKSVTFDRRHFAQATGPGRP